MDLSMIYQEGIKGKAPTTAGAYPIIVSVKISDYEFSPESRIVQTVFILTISEPSRINVFEQMVS